MYGSTEMQSDELDALRRQDFDDYVEELMCDRERELARIEATPEPEPWLYETEPLSPLLQSMCNDIYMRISQAVQRRKYRPMREWL
jgi:hypothetical protein